MSEAFESARAEAMADEAEHVEVLDDAAPAADDAAAQDDAPAAKNWEKIAQDKEAALAAERSRRKAEAKRARDLEDRLTRIEADRTKSQADPLEELAAKLREDDEDPIGDIATTKALIKQFLAAQKQEREAQTTVSTQQRQIDQIRSAMEEHEADFATDHPDYHKAAQHYRADRQAELEELGYTGQQLSAKLAQDLFGVVTTALGAGRDPAEAVYKLAKKRGFAAEDQGAKDAADKLAKLAAAGDSAARPGSSQTKGGPMSWADVSKLKGAARDAAWAKLREQERRAG